MEIESKEELLPRDRFCKPISASSSFHTHDDRTDESKQPFSNLAIRLQENIVSKFQLIPPEFLERGNSMSHVNERISNLGTHNQYQQEQLFYKINDDELSDSKAVNNEASLDEKNLHQKILINQPQKMIGNIHSFPITALRSSQLSKTKSITKFDEKQRLKRLKNVSESSTSLQVSTIPRCQMKSKRIFYLKGEIFIDLNKSSHSCVSNLNYYKNVRCVRLLHDINALYSEYEVHPELYDTHSSAIAMLEHQPDQEMQVMSVRIREHEEIYTNDIKIKQQIAQIFNNNQLIQQLVVKLDLDFLQERSSVLANLPKDSFCIFVDYSFDYIQMVFKTTGMGISGPFAHLLGCDLKTLQEISMRKGILEFISAESRWKLLEKILSLGKQFPRQKGDTLEGRIQLITLDDIEVDTQYSISNFESKSTQLRQSFFHQQYHNQIEDRGFAVFKLHISDFHVQQINSIRIKQQHRQCTTEYLPSLLDKNQNSQVYEGTTIKQKYQGQNLCSSGLIYDHSNVFNSTNLSKQDIIPHSQHDKQLDKKVIHNMLNFNFNQAIQRNDYSLNDIQQSKSIINTPKIKELINDIPYQVQSQLFIEKFYEEQLQKGYPEKPLQDQFPSITCGYRTISISR